MTKRSSVSDTATSIKQAFERKNTSLTIGSTTKKGSGSGAGKTYRFMIHPNNLRRRCWDAVTATLVTYLCWMIPFQSAFELEDDDLNLTIFHAIMDTWFFCDILLGLRTGFIHYGDVHMEPKEVFWNYAKTWMLIDFLAFFPFSSLVSRQDFSDKTLKFLKYSKLPKLLRVGKLLKYLRQYVTYFRLILATLVWFFVMHINACVWIFTVDPCAHSSIASVPQCTLDEIWTYYEEGLFLSLSFAGGIPVAAVLGESGMKLYAANANQDFHHIHVLGGIFCATTGLFAFFYMTASITQFMQLQGRSENAYRRKLDDVKYEMAYFELPGELRTRVKIYYDYLWMHNKSMGDSIALLSDSGMSRTLRGRIALHLYQDLIQRVPFFATGDIELTLLQELCLNLKVRIYLPGDAIITKGDIGKELFIISRGTAQVTPDENIKEPIPMLEGSFFGEISLLMNQPRTASVVAITICELCILTKAVFDQIILDFPTFGRNMMDLISQRKMTESSDPKGLIKREIDHRRTKLEDAVESDETLHHDNSTTSIGSGGTAACSCSKLEQRMAMLEKNISKLMQHHGVLPELSIRPPTTTVVNSTVSATDSVFANNN